jgi:hypothetical protein
MKKALREKGGELSMNTQVKQHLLPEQPPVLSYEAPCIEAVLTPEELEREVLYAGNSVT